MNELLTLYLNLDEGSSDENERLIDRIDGLLLKVGIEYMGIRNMYRPAEARDRDRAVFAACRALKDAEWLKGILAAVPIMHRMDACPMEQIRCDHMTEPSAAKLDYYEAYYRETRKLAHGIVVDESGQLRDGYISYLLAEKYGIRAEIYEAFAEQPLRKVVKGRHAVKRGERWEIKNDRIYIWNYTLKDPVVPGDILKVRTKKGDAFMCVHGIGYVTGKEFCREHRSAVRHMQERLRSGSDS